MGSFRITQKARRRIMSQIELSYEELKQGMIKEIQKHELVFLATSERELVTNRMVRLVSNGLSFFFLTNVNSRKYKQIMANQNVAIAVGGLQIEGMASLKGHPQDEENTEFIKAFRESRPEAYEMSLKKGNLQGPVIRLFEIVPRRIALYTSRPSASEPGAYTDILNTVREEAYRVPWISASGKSLNFR
jgi:general stress protein 26